MAGDRGTGQQQIAITAGAYTIIYGTRLSRMVRIWEDGSVNGGQGQGLTIQLPDPASPTGVQNWLAAQTIEPQSEPFVIGDDFAIHQPYGGHVANGPGVIVGVGVTAATPICQIKSAGLATLVNVMEYS